MAVEITGCELEASSLVQRKYPTRLLYEIAGAVMDDSEKYWNINT